MDVSVKGKSLQLYFIDGRPEGMVTAEVFNWTGHVLVAPRTQISTALSRREACHTGVYLLLGEREGEPVAYVGEAEDVSARIRSHDAVKDWWDSAVIMTSHSNSLNKAHVKYLEACLVQEARAIDRVLLDNSNAPARPNLSEADQANMETFLEHLFMILPALRIDVFVSNKRPAEIGTEPVRLESGQLFELLSPKRGLKATAVLQGGEFVVQAGSLARLKWAERGSKHSYSKLHAELVRTGVLRGEGRHCVFTENYAAKSPSAAAAVISGRPTNGRIAWKVKGEKRTYKQWEAEQLAF